MIDIIIVEDDEDLRNLLQKYLILYGYNVLDVFQNGFEFIEKYKCGVLVDNEKEFIDAIDYIQDRLKEMKRNALICAKEYIDALGKYKILLEALSRFR